MTGEAAGIAMGLVELGSKSETAIEDMVAYAQETQHEKILRGLAVGIALLMYGRLEEADTLIESLCNDKVGLSHPFYLLCFHLVKVLFGCFRMMFVVLNSNCPYLRG